MFSPGIIGYAGAGDPYFSNVVSLLHFDGADASTTFTDQIGKTWTAGGNAQIKTNQSVFGGASGYFDGSGDYVTTPNTTDHDFGAGEFCIECRARWDTTVGNSTFIAKDDQLTGRAFTFLMDANKLSFNFWDSGGTQRTYAPAWTPSANTWYAIAAARVANTLRLFVDGTIVGTSFDMTPYTIRSVNYQTSIGMHFHLTAYPFKGWIDELRITKGVGRYSANYTVDATAFPNS